MLHFRHSRLLASIPAALALLAFEGGALAQPPACANSLTTLCPSRITAWKVFAASSSPLSDVALVILDLPPSSPRKDDDALPTLGERVASVMRANGIPTRFAGHVAHRPDAGALPEVAQASHLLVLVPAGSSGSDGGVDYVALLSESAHPAQPVFQSSMRLGKDLRPRVQDISTTEFVNAIFDAGLLDRARHTPAPIALFGS